MGKDTPSFTAVINAILERRLLDIHTSIPGIIQRYDPGNKKADIRPAIKRKFIDDSSLQELNVITDVPVAFPQTNTFLFSYPLQKGDEVLLIFSERSLDKWLKDGKIVNPEDPRKFDLSDAIAVPILKPIGKGLKADSQHMLIQHGDSTFKMSKDGKLSIVGTSDLLQLLEDLCQACADILVNTKIGPQSPINMGTFLNIKSKIGGMKI